MGEIGDEIEQPGCATAQVEADFEHAMLRIPNPPEPDVPVAPDEAGNVVVRSGGTKPEL